MYVLYSLHSGHTAAFEIPFSFPPVYALSALEVVHVYVFSFSVCLSLNPGSTLGLPLKLSWLPFRTDTALLLPPRCNQPKKPFLLFLEPSNHPLLTSALKTPMF